MWVRRIMISLLLLIGLPLLGVGAGFRLLDAWRRSDDWEALGRPSVMPAEIVDADLSQVLVRGQDGSLYVCDQNGPTRDNACWEQVDQIAEGYGGVSHDTYRGSVEIPPAPGAVMQTLDVSWHAAERASYARYILLEDGSLWVWDHHADANWSLVLLAVGPICGQALAVVIVVLWWGVAGLRALWRRGQAKRES
jgi:hypothetical protein